MRKIIHSIETNGGRKRTELASEMKADGLHYEICRSEKNGRGEFRQAGSAFRYHEKNADIVFALVSMSKEARR